MQCLQNLRVEGFEADELTMDDDSSSFARARRSLVPALKMKSDRNHVLKNFTNGLYKIKESNKQITREHINYLRTCFSYATAQNKGMNIIRYNKKIE